MDSKVNSELKIEFKPGEKDIKDQLIFIEGKPITLKNLLQIIQEFSKNELKINRKVIERTGHFFFKEAIIDAINQIELSEICRKYKIPTKKLKEMKI